MAYYNEIMIATTKEDYKKIEEVQKKIPENFLFEDAYIYDYKENDLDCIFIKIDHVRYDIKFEEVEKLEKSLNELENGYVFCRLGEDSGDIEFRNRTKLSELMIEFEFIKKLSESLNRELKVDEEEEFE